MKVIYISDNPDHHGQRKLVESLERHGWEHHYIYSAFRGLGFKITELAQYLRRSGDEEFIMMDAYDTYAVADPTEFILVTDRLIVSGEKQCYPDPNKSHYFIHASPWRYVNSGQIYGNSKYFLDLVERFPFPEEDNDQTWYTDLAIKGLIDIDYKCRAFQSIAFEEPRELTFSPGERRIINNVYMSYPVFIHGNGKTPMDKVYNL
jgi:hypothetical protein